MFTKMMAKSTRMMAISTWKNKINNRINRIALTVCALLFLAVPAVCVSASERGLTERSSLSGLSDLIELLGAQGGSAAGSGSGSDSSQDASGSGLLQEVLELLGAASDIPIRDVTVSKIGEKEYTGKEIRPLPKLTYNGKTLKRGTDYSLSYSENVKVGTAKCKITGKGAYKGTRTVSFKIVKKGSKGSSASSSTEKSKSSKKFTVKLSKTSYEYTGSEKKPSVKVTSSGKSVPSSAYTVSYKANKNVGTATVTVKGKGDYKGYLGTASFKITLKKVTLSSVKSDESGSMTVNWKSDSQADGYQLEYATNKSFTSAVKKKQIADGKETTCTIEKLNSAKMYYARIRSYHKSGSRNSYGPWSTVKNVKIK